MAEDKKGFILYADYIHTIKKLPDEMAGKLLKLILSYVNDEDPQPDDLMLSIVFEPIKQQMKRDLKAYEDKKKRYQEAGRKGGEKRAENMKQGEAISSDAKPSLEIKAVNVTDNVNVNVNDTVNVNKTIKSIDDRKKDFSILLQTFVPIYGQAMINDFYNYWTESNPKGSKFRAEMQKTFDMNLRLKTWSGRNFNKNAKGVSSGDNSQPKMVL